MIAHANSTPGCVELLDSDRVGSRRYDGRLAVPLILLTHIYRKRFPVVTIAFGLRWLLRFLFRDKITNPGIWTGGVVRRVA